MEKVNSNISRTLWELLDVQYGFRKYLLAMRNMYLIGKGELFQNILDGILDLLEDPSTPSIQDSDSLLNLNILRNAAKLVNLDEEAFLRAINMRVSVSNIVLKVVSTDHFRIAGSATSSKSGIKLISFTAPEFSEIFANMWAAHKVLIRLHLCAIFLIHYDSIHIYRLMCLSIQFKSPLPMKMDLIYQDQCGYWIKNMWPKGFQCPQGSLLMEKLLDR